MDCAYIGFDSETSCYNATILTDAKECYFCYQIEHLVSNCPTLLKKKEENTKKVTNNIQLTKLYVKKNIPEEPIKVFGGKSYVEMVTLNPSNNRNNANSSGSQKAGLQVNNKEGQQKRGAEQPWKSEIDELRQQVNKMAKLLNAIASKLEVIVEKKNENKVVIYPSSHISEEKKEGGNKKVKQNMSSRHNLKEGKKAYNPEKKINKIKKVEKQDNWNDAMIGESKSIETDDIKDKQFDFVVITETKLTPLKEKGVFFGTEEYHAFWKSNTEKQMGTGMSILVKKCWTHHVKIIKSYYGKLLHLVLKFRSRISVHVVGLYMLVFKSTTEKAVAKEIRKLLADIVQNKKIVIVVGDLNEDLAFKSLEETFATNKKKNCLTTTLLQHMNLVNTHGMYAVNNPDNTWTSNGIQKRLNYVFTNVVTASLVTNIGVIDVNEIFSTDHKAVKTVLQTAECLPKRKVGVQSAHTKKKCMDYKLVKIVADIIKQIRVNNADMYNNNVIQLLAK
ncbi:hypothetical protein G9A89_007959 [Geosiphon pyriformis]|nr:hypothetical protein G9A89_007959 [Geosiphon pyriformis]